MNKVRLSPDIMKRVASGDERAFEELYYKTYKPLYAFLLSLTKNQDDASDLMQETYIKVHGSCHLYREQGNPVAWIMKISKNLFLMKLRKEKNEIIDRDQPVEELQNIAFDNIENSENRIWLEQLFSAVTDEERNIIIMHVMMGLKNREIAGLLEIPIGTVLSRYRRGIAKLKKSVED